MSTIFVQVEPTSDCIIQEYVCIFFICNTTEFIVYNSLTIKNEGHFPIKSVSVYVPYQLEWIGKDIQTSVNNYEIRKFYDKYSEFAFNLSPLQIGSGSSLRIEFSYNLTNNITKTHYGYPMYLPFYNLNFLKDIIPTESLDKNSIPPIDKSKINLIAVCSKNHTFNNFDSTPEIGNISEEEDINSLIKSAIIKITSLCEEEIVWTDFLSWGHPQLTELPSLIAPGDSGRTVKAYFDKYDIRQLGNLEFTYPDIINLSISIVSLLIAGIGIYLALK